MRSFRRFRATATDRASLSDWRGRAIEITDPAELPLPLVLEALKTEPEPGPILDSLDYPRVAMDPLGLRFVDLDLDLDDHAGHFTYSGVRHGRQVLLRHGDHIAGGRGAMVVWVGVGTPALSAREEHGALVAECGAPPLLTQMLTGLAAAPRVWRGMHVVGGERGIVVHRETRRTMDPLVWAADLWLAERIADLFGTASLVRVESDPFRLPYGLGARL